MDVKELLARLEALFTPQPERFVPNPTIVDEFNKVHENEQYRRGGYTTQDTGEIVALKAPVYNKNFLSPEDIYATLDNEYYQNVPTGYGVIQQGRQIAPQLTANAYNYALNYPGTRYTPEILNILRQYLDEDTLVKAIAASQAETGMGKAAYSFKNDGQLKERNWFGLHIGDSTYDPPTWEQMAKDINRNFGPEGPYSDITPENAYTYTGGDRTSNWLKIVLPALKEMGYGM